MREAPQMLGKRLLRIALIIVAVVASLCAQTAKPVAIKAGRLFDPR